MTEWEPATEAEAAMRDALRASDQELYFRILAHTELVLPVSGHSPSGETPAGWGTWTTGGRTHVLAFTSGLSMRACLGQNAGASRQTAYRDLASNWPNLEWWLAVNPGLPIEGYLPAWFVSQLARGDVRLPGRTIGARARLERAEAVARARATAAVPGRTNGPAPSQAAPPPRAREAPTPAGPPFPGPQAPPVTPPPPTSAWLTAAHRPARADEPAGANGGRAQGLAGVNGGPDGAVDAGLVSRAPVPRSARPPSDPPLSGWYAAASKSARRPAPLIPDPAGPVDDDASSAPAYSAFSDVASLDSAPVPMALPVDSASAVVASTDVAPATADPAAPDAAARGEGPLLGDRPTAAVPLLNGSAGGPAASTPAESPVAGGQLPPDFVPANEVEESLLAAAGGGSTDTFLSTLLLARVLLPVSALSAKGARPGQDGFSWRTETLDNEPYVVVFTSPERLADHLSEPVETVSVKFVQLIHRWPDDAWSFAVNPGTPVGAKLPGSQIVALSNWAAEVGLGDDADAGADAGDAGEPTRAKESTPGSTRAPAREDPGRPPMMQKAIAPSQIAFYLDRGYDRVSGFVHRVNEVAHLNTPAKLHAALGLGYPDSPFSPTADEVYVLRWPAYRPSLYRIPYGGQSEAAMRAMQGWVIERAPFRGNGFAPGESRDVVAEFKVDSARLPHGTELWRIGADGSAKMIATLDSDVPVWQKVGDR